MARTLDPALEASLQHCTTHSTLFLEMASGAILRMATANIHDIGGFPYLPILKVTDSLRMSLTLSSDNIGMEIENMNLEKGRAFIADEKALIGSFAVFGCYFKNNETLQEWHDEKIAGEIVASEINGDAILIKFVSDLDAAEYYGVTLASIFPDRSIPVETPPPPSLEIAPFPYFHNHQKLPALFDEYDYGRYYLPRDLDLLQKSV